MKPIIKWAGGKTQLLEEIKPMLPKDIDTYYEPFAGGLALLLDVQPKKAIVNDYNEELTNLYTQVRDNVEDFIGFLSAMDYEHEHEKDCKAYYYHEREHFNFWQGHANSSIQAARFVYLNKHCFNGLYRVNSKGEFNVSFNGKKKGKSFDEKNVREVSEYLKGVEILTGDFENACRNAQAGDFVFFDSPYAPINPTSFIDYTKEGFDLEDHKRLAKLFKELTDKGVKCMATNHNTELIRELYKDYNIKVVKVKRLINSNAEDRIGEEVIITNY